MNREVRALIEWAEERGWSCSPTRKGHLKFSHPDRRTVFGPSTPSEYRSLKNVKAKLRRSARAR